MGDTSPTKTIYASNARTSTYLASTLAPRLAPNAMPLTILGLQTARCLSPDIDWKVVLMPTLECTDTEAQQLMFVLANAEGKGITWAVVNPLLMKFGGQIQQHQAKAAVAKQANGEAEYIPRGLAS